MKTKTRNYSVCALVAAVLLAVAMLVTGCPEEPVTEAPGYTIPAGMGIVHLNFNKTIQRTILPDEIKVIDDFAQLGVEFLADSSGSKPGTTVPVKYFGSAAAVAAETFTLKFGDYIIRVIGYLEDGEDVIPPEEPNPPEKPAAIAEVKLTVASETPYNEHITLYAITAPHATQTGTFSWVITNSIDPDRDIEAKMTIVPITDLDNPAEIKTLDPSETDWSSSEPLELAVGFYYVIFEFEVDGDIVFFRHVLHIYQNQESKFEYEFTDDYFAIVTVEFGSAKITIDYEPPEDVVFKLNDGIKDYGEGETLTVVLGGSVTIEVTNNDEFEGGSIEWYCNGTESIGDSFEVDTADPPFDVAKLYHLSVIGVGKEDGQIYGTYILIDVVEGP